MAGGSVAGMTCYYEPESSVPAKAALHHTLVCWVDPTTRRRRLRCRLAEEQLGEDGAGRPCCEESLESVAAVLPQEVGVRLVSRLPPRAGFKVWPGCRWCARSSAFRRTRIDALDERRSTFSTSIGRRLSWQARLAEPKSSMAMRCHVRSSSMVAVPRRRLHDEALVTSSSRHSAGRLNSRRTPHHLHQSVSRNCLATVDGMRSPLHARLPSLAWGARRGEAPLADRQIKPVSSAAE